MLYIPFHGWARVMLQPCPACTNNAEGHFFQSQKGSPPCCSNLLINVVNLQQNPIVSSQFVSVRSFIVFWLLFHYVSAQNFIKVWVDTCQPGSFLTMAQPTGFFGLGHDTRKSPAQCLSLGFWCFNRALCKQKLHMYNSRLVFSVA